MSSQTDFGKNFKNVVIISLDCVRSEALGCYPQKFPWRSRVFQGVKTPNINQLCAGGHRFEQAITHAPFTPAAHASLFTGLLPPKHNVRKFLGTKLSEDTMTLAEILSAEGWLCGAVIGSHALSKEYGFARGFDYYDDDIQTGFKDWILGERRGASEATDRAVAWLSSLKPDVRFFLFVHYYDAHNISVQPIDKSPHDDQARSSTGLRYFLRQTLPGPIQAIIRPIDRVIRSGYYSIRRNVLTGFNFVLRYFEAGEHYRRFGRRFMLSQTTKIDAQVGRLVKALSDQGQLDETLIVVLADHGDDFMEHGEPTHRMYLYDTTLLVPLIIYPRLGRRSVIKEQVRLIDVMPTVLSALGVQTSTSTEGESLIELVDAPVNEGVSKNPRKAYSETIFETIDNDVTEEVEIVSCYASLRTYPWKLIWNRLENSYELYRIDIDPHENHDCISNHLDLVTTMTTELRELAQGMPESVSSTNDILAEWLEALGYL